MLLTSFLCDFCLLSFKNDQVVTSSNEIIETGPGSYLKNSCLTSTLRKLESTCKGVQVFAKLKFVGFSEIELLRGISTDSEHRLSLILCRTAVLKNTYFCRRLSIAASETSFCSYLHYFLQELRFFMKNISHTNFVSFVLKTYHEIIMLF